MEDEYFNVGVEEIGGAPIVSYVQPMAPPQPTVQPVAPAPVQPPPAAPAKTEPAAPPAAEPVDGTPLSAPMPGMIIRFEINVGDEIKEGETAVILEAMKMENALPAPTSGTVKAINFSSGDSVAKGDVLCVIG